MEEYDGYFTKEEWEELYHFLLQYDEEYTKVVNETLYTAIQKVKTIQLQKQNGD